jgi:hypothetical protein
MAIWPASQWPNNVFSAGGDPAVRRPGAKRGRWPAPSQSEEWTWKDDPAAAMSGLAMKVIEQPWRWAISLAPCL